jgi:hypothetical protein
MSNVNSQRASSATQKPTAAEFTQRVQNSKGNEKPSACVGCKQKVTIFPLRYGVVASDKIAERNKLTPNFPAHLKPDLPKQKLKSARHAINRLRAGYLYVFTKRIIRDAKNPSIEEFKCEALFTVSESGILNYTKTQSGNIRLTRLADMIIVHDVPSIKEFRLLFTPDPLTSQMIKRITTEEELKNKVQFFDLNANIKNPTGKDVLAQELIHKHLAESIATRLGDVPAGAAKANRADFESVKVLEAQLFAVPLLSDVPYEEFNKKYLPGMFGNDQYFNHFRLIETQLSIELLKIENEEMGKGFAVVLDDAIGITQALNAWCNAGVEDTLEAWLQTTTDDNGIQVSNERKLHTAHAFMGVKKAYQVRMAWMAYYDDLMQLREKIFKAHPSLGNPHIHFRRLKTAEDGSRQITDPAETLRHQQSLAEMETTLESRLRDAEEERQTGQTRDGHPGRYGGKHNDFAPRFRAARERLEREEDRLWKKIEDRIDKNDFLTEFNARFVTSELVDVAAMEAQLKTFEDKTVEARKCADGRSADHKVWLKYEGLLKAFDFYDPEALKNKIPQDKANGHYFAGQVSLCISGAESRADTQELIEEWWVGDATDIKNLLLRGLGLNQTDILQELKDISDHLEYTVKQTKQKVEKKTQAEEDAWLSSFLETTLGLSKKLVKLYKAANTVVENLPEGETRFAGAGLLWFGNLGPRFLRYKPNGPEGWLFARTFTWFAGRIGNNAIEIALETARSRSSAGGFRGSLHQYLSRIPTELEKQYLNAKTNSFYKVRMGTGVLFLEAAVLLLMIHRLPEEDRESWWAGELAAQVLILSAAGFELAAAGADLAMRSFSASSTTRPGATMFFGRLKMAGGTLAAAGAGLIAIIDVLEAGERLDNAVSNRELSVAYAYYSRAATITFVAAGQAGLVMAALEPTLALLIKRYPLSTFYAAMYRASIWFAGSKLLLATWVLRANWVILAISVLIWIADDSPLDAWCKNSAFRMGKYKTKRKPFKDAKTELKELFEAM